MKTPGKKQIGITIDPYKKKKFSKALELAGYEHEIKTLIPGEKGALIIIILVDENEFEKHKQKIGRICARLQINFRHSN